MLNPPSESIRLLFQRYLQADCISIHPKVSFKNIREAYGGHFHGQIDKAVSGHPHEISG